MQVKIDTKENFHVISTSDRILPATMTDGMRVALLPFLQNEIKNVILNVQSVEKIDREAAQQILQIQREFYENNASFVTCAFQKPVVDFLSEVGIMELFNSTPTESEAGDIILMEEIERELMDSDNPDLDEIDEELL